MKDEFTLSPSAVSLSSRYLESPVNRSNWRAGVRGIVRPAAFALLLALAFPFPRAHSHAPAIKDVNNN